MISKELKKFFSFSNSSYKMNYLKLLKKIKLLSKKKKEKIFKKSKYVLGTVQLGKNTLVTIKLHNEEQIIF